MSSKRRIRRQSGKKTQDRILATITATSDDLSFSYDKQRDKLDIRDAKIESIHQETFYERDSGKDKIVSFEGLTDFQIQGQLNLLRRYARIRNFQ